MSTRTLVALITRCGAIAASFLMAVVVARTLNISDAGIFFVVFTTSTIAATFGRFGVDMWVLKAIASPGTRAGSFRPAWAVVTIASAIAGIAMFAGMHVAGSGAFSLTVLLASAVSIPALALAVVAGAVLRGYGKMVSGIMAELGFVPLATALAVVGYTYFGAPTLDGVLVTYACTAAVAAGIYVPIAAHSTRSLSTIHSSGTVSDLRNFVRANGRSLAELMMSALLVYAVTWAPVFALTAAGDLTGVAIFTVAIRLANILMLVPTVQTSYLSPMFPRLFVSGELDALNDLTRKSARHALAVVIVPALVLFIGAEPIVRAVFGEDLASASVPVRILTGSVILVVSFGQVNTLMLLCNLEHVAVRLNIAAALPWVIVGIWVAETWGVIGVSVMSATLTASYACVSALLLHRIRGIKSSVL